MKQSLSYILVATIIVTAVIMVVSFFATFPQPFVIVDTVILILATALYLFLDNKNKND